MPRTEIDQQRPKFARLGATGADTPGKARGLPNAACREKPAFPNSRNFADELCRVECGATRAGLARLILIAVSNVKQKSRINNSQTNT